MQRLLRSASSQLKHSSFIKRSALIPLSLLMAACVTQSPTPPQPAPPVTARTQPVAPPLPPVDPVEQQELRSLITLQDRLYRVAAPLLVNNTQLCQGNARKLLGFSAKNKYSYSADYVDAAARAFGFDERLRITSVLPGSGAAAAGVNVGDILVAVEDKTMPLGDNAERLAARILTPMVTPRAKALKLTVNRNGANATLNVPLTVACAFAIELGNADIVNAYGDGRRVLVTRGMMSFTQDDDELAYVLAKELAHNALGHAKKQKMNATMGGIIDNLILTRPDMRMMVGTAGVRPLPQALDAAADVLSLYWLARAGYDPDAAFEFWQRLADQYPASVANAYTAIHPATAYRVSAMKKNLLVLENKQSSGKPLRP